MYPFNEDKDKRRKDPFDFFGFDEEFERIFRNMKRMWESAFKEYNFDQLEPGKSFVHGFNVHIGPDDKPIIEEFGNRPKKIDEEKNIVPDELEPLTDIIESDKDIFITVEMQGVEKEEIDLNISEASLDIIVNSPNRKYQKTIDFPCIVIPTKVKTTYKNGILDIIIKRKHKKKNNEGYHVSID